MGAAGAGAPRFYLIRAECSRAAELQLPSDARIAHRMTRGETNAGSRSRTIHHPECRPVICIRRPDKRVRRTGRGRGWFDVTGPKRAADLWLCSTMSKIGGEEPL